MEFIHQVVPYVTDEESRALDAYLKGGGWLTEFGKTRELEASIAEFVGAKHGICVTSGTVGIYLTLKAAGVGPGSKVAVPNYTMVASINCILWCDAEPVICDVHADTFCADLSTIPNPEEIDALVYVAMNGRSEAMAQVVAFCEQHNIKLIEDTAQAMCSLSNGQALGTFGVAGIYSFTPHKIMTTGQGGIVVTNDDDVAERVRKLKDFHRVGAGVDDHDGIGFNFKFTDLQAVVGIEQFRIIDFRIQQKRNMYRRYQERLSEISEVELFAADLEQNVPWFIDVLVKDQETRDNLIGHLKEKQIGSRKFYPPINSQQPFSHFPPGSFPVSEDRAPRGIWLPSSVGITDDEIDRVCSTVATFF